MPVLLLRAILLFRAAGRSVHRPPQFAKRDTLTSVRGHACDPDAGFDLPIRLSVVSVVLIL
jgi:hypothetical protein